jgi:hypothetical protein
MTEDGSCRLQQGGREVGGRRQGRMCIVHSVGRTRGCGFLLHSSVLGADCDPTSSTPLPIGSCYPPPSSPSAAGQMSLNMA